MPIRFHSLKTKRYKMKEKQQTRQIYIHLTPKASKNALGQRLPDINGISVFKATVTAVPEKGKANKALINMLAKKWHCPKTSLTIIKGETDRLKLIELPESIYQDAITVFINNIPSR